MTEYHKERMAKGLLCALFFCDLVDKGEGLCYNNCDLFCVCEEVLP